MVGKENKVFANLERACFLRSSFAMCVTDALGEIVVANAAFGQMVGHPVGEVQHQRLWLLWPLPVRKVIRSLIPLKKNRLQFNFEVHNINSNMSYHANVEKISNRRRPIYYLWHFTADPTGQMNLQSMISLLRQTPHEFDDAILLLDQDGRILFCNELSRWGWLFKKRKLHNRTLEDVCKKKYGFAVREWWQKVKGGRYVREVLCFELPSGELKWLECIFSPIHLHGQKPLVLALFHDVSEAKNREHETEVARRTYFALLQKLDVGVVVIGRDRFLYANAAAEKILGQPFTPGMRGLDPQVKKYPQNYRLWQNAQRRLRGEQLPERYEHAIVLSDGTRRDLSITSRLVEVDGQNHVVATLVDLTDLKVNERLLRQRADELQILNRISEVCNQTLTLDAILSDALAIMMKIFEAEVGVVYLYDEEKQTLHLAKARGLGGQKLYSAMPRHEELPLIKNAFEHGRPLYSCDPQTIASYPLLHNAGVTSFLVIPIFCKSKKLGTINFGNYGKKVIRNFSEDVLLGIGNQMGLAIENARLLQAREEQIRRHQQVEKALRESETRYRTLAETAHDMIYMLDRDDHVVYANRFAASQFGVEAEQLIGRKRAELFPSAIGDRQKKTIDEVIRTGKPHYVEEQTPFGDQMLWIGTWLSPIFDDSGKVEQILGISRDITTAKETEIALKASEQRFRDIIERSLDGYYFIDVNGRVKTLNRAFEEISAFKRAEVIGKEVYSLLDAKTSKQVRKTIARVMGGKNIKAGEIFITSSKGDRRWYSYNARRVIDKGIVIGMEGFVKDITRQKAIAESLRRSEAMYRALFDSIPYEVFAMDRNGNYTGANRLFIQNWGEVIGKKAAELGQKNQVHLIFDTLRLRVMKTQIIVQESFETDLGLGPVFYSCILSPVLTETNETIGLIGLNIDVTEQTLSHEHLRILSKRLVQVQEEERARIAREIHDSLGQYLTALQFEIRSALQNTSGSSYQRLLEAQQTIKQSINIASTLCYTLRPPLLDDFGLVAALKDYFREFQQKWKIPIDFQSEDLHDVLSKDQETALFRITQEALTNILKHAQAHHISVQLNLKNDYVLFTISDDGRGFNYHLLQKQLNNTGFGLITMKERAELLGGRFHITSAESGGTKISVEMPLKEGAIP